VPSALLLETQLAGH